MMPCDHVKVCPAIVVCGLGSELEVKSGEPTAVLDERSVRTDRANRTAPSTFTSPAPCSSMLKPESCCAEYIRIILIVFGVRFGLACNIKATVPATTGVAIDVPLRYIKRLLLSSVIPESNCGFCLIKLFGTETVSPEELDVVVMSDSAYISLFPGATRSGLTRLS